MDAQVKGHGVEKGVLFSRKLIISFIFSLRRDTMSMFHSAELHLFFLLQSFDNAAYLVECQIKLFPERGQVGRKEIVG